MAISISTNLASINAQRNLSLSQSGLATSMQRLSSGLRVNSAKDDAAGLAISERMHSQIRGMNQAARNANDAISLLQTAEGASSKVNDMLQRMRELAVQSINDTNSESDRKALQAEVAQLKLEVDRVGITSKFNGTQIFHPSRTRVAGSDPDALELLEKLKGGWLAQAEKLVKDLYGIEADNYDLEIDVTSFTDGPWNTGAYVSSATGSSGPGTGLKLVIDIADYKAMTEDKFISVLAHEMVHAVMARGQSWGNIRLADKSNHWFIEGVAEFIYGADERIGQEGGWNVVKADPLTNWGDSTLDYASGFAAVSYLHQELVTLGVSDGVKAVLQQLQNTSQSLESAIRNATGHSSWDLSDFLTTYQSMAQGLSSPTWLNLANTDSGGISGSDVNSTNPSKTVAEVIASAAGAGPDLNGFEAKWEEIPSGGTGPSTAMAFQVGANAGDFVYTYVGSMNLGALGIDQVDISTSAGATSALGRLDAAMDYVNSQRGNMGALMNRFENIIATLQISSENTSASRGRIIDADYAGETANLARTQILQQAGTAMVAQANQMPRLVEALLR